MDYNYSDFVDVAIKATRAKRKRFWNYVAAALYSVGAIILLIFAAYYTREMVLHNTPLYWPIIFGALFLMYVVIVYFRVSTAITWGKTYKIWLIILGDKLKDVIIPDFNNHYNQEDKTNEQ